jgi:hypothetical protein
MLLMEILIVSFILFCMHACVFGFAEASICIICACRRCKVAPVPKETSGQTIVCNVSLHGGLFCTFMQSAKPRRTHACYCHAGVVCRWMYACIVKWSEMEKMQCNLHFFGEVNRANG